MSKLVEERTPAVSTILPVGAIATWRYSWPGSLPFQGTLLKPRILCCTSSYMSKGHMGSSPRHHGHHDLGVGQVPCNVPRKNRAHGAEAVAHQRTSNGVVRLQVLGRVAGSHSRESGTVRPPIIVFSSSVIRRCSFPSSSVSI